MSHQGLGDEASEEVWERPLIPPCHSRPHRQWCDWDGPGGFMGHTCYELWYPLPWIEWRARE